ncbi:MAG: hypothetical protein ACK5NN_02090 [Sphingomonadaceae bacterium]
MREALFLFVAVIAIVAAIFMPSGSGEGGGTLTFESEAKVLRTAPPEPPWVFGCSEEGQRRDRASMAMRDHIQSVRKRLFGAR